MRRGDDIKVKYPREINNNKVFKKKKLVQIGPELRRSMIKHIDVCTNLMLIKMAYQLHGIQKCLHQNEVDIKGVMKYFN